MIKKVISWQIESIADRSFGCGDDIVSCIDQSERIGEDTIFEFEIAESGAVILLRDRVVAGWEDYMTIILKNNPRCFEYRLKWDIWWFLEFSSKFKTIVVSQSIDALCYGDKYSLFYSSCKKTFDRIMIVYGQQYCDVIIGKDCFFGL